MEGGGPVAVSPSARPEGSSKNRVASASSRLDTDGPLSDFLEQQNAFFSHLHTDSASSHVEAAINGDCSVTSPLPALPSLSTVPPPSHADLASPPPLLSPGKENGIFGDPRDPFANLFSNSSSFSSSSASSASSSSASCEHSGDDDDSILSSSEIREQLRLQLAAARYVQQGAVPPAEILFRIHQALPKRERRKWRDANGRAARPAVTHILQKIRQGSRQEAFEQLEERRRLLDGLLDGKNRELYEQFCCFPESVRVQATLERRLHSLARFQESLRSAVVEEGRRTLAPPSALLLRPQVPRSLHERAFLCLCSCAGCCRKSHPVSERLLASSLADASSSQRKSDVVALHTKRENAPCCGCCCFGFCRGCVSRAAGAGAAASRPGEKKSGRKDDDEKREKGKRRATLAWPAASGCGVFDALGHVSGDDAWRRGPTGYLQRLAIKARHRTLSAVQQVYAAVQARPCPALQPPLRQQQQRRRLWHQAAAQVRSMEMREEWREKRAVAKRLAATAASQVAAIKQKQQQLREKAQKERMRLLKENDMASYMKLVEDTKNARLRELLAATDAFLTDLSVKVRAQQVATKDLARQHQMSEDRRKQTDDLGDGEAAFGDAHKGSGEAQKGGNEVEKIDKADEKTEETEKKEEREKKEKKEDDAQNSSGSWALGQDQYYAMSHQVQEEVQQPSTLTGGDLMPYQMAGLSWMLSLYNNDLHGILADEMGLGKTIQTIALLAYLKEFKNNSGPHLIIAPLSTLPNWADEFRRWCPSLKVVVLKGGRLERRELQRELRRGDFNVCLTTFDLAMRERHGLSFPNWRHLVVDEGHRMKNSKSKFHICVSEFRATHRLLLTGTPLQNNLAELWSLLNFLLPKIFSCASDFEKWFSQPFEGQGMPVEGGDPDGAGTAFLNEEERLLIINRLHAVLRPFLLRRVKKDVLKDMPERKEYLVRICLSAWQQAVYKQIQEKGLRTVDQVGHVTKRGFQNTLMQLRKIANHPYLFVDEYLVNEDLVRVAGKFECLDRMLPKLLHFKHKVLIFSQMTQVLDLMAEYMHLRGYKYARLDGSVGLTERKERMEEFNNAEVDTMIFMLSTRAGGLGLNLQAADTVVLFDSDFNPHQDLQAMCRAHRLGQTKQVKVFRLVTISGVEEIILEKANRKLNIDQMVIQAGMFDNKSSEELREEKLRLLLLLHKGTTGDTTATTPLQ
ncbi:putative SWI2/SNF2 Brahma-like, partial [Toxoplasma gondii p89]